MACMTDRSLVEIVVGGPALLEARHPLLLFWRKIRSLQEIPPPLPRPPHGHDALPSLDARVIPGAQDLRHLETGEDLGPRVLRMLEEAPRERVARRSRLVAQRSRAEPRHRFRHYERRHLAPREHVIADGQ